MEEIYEKYKSRENLVEKQGDYEFLNSIYINEIFENGDIKSSTKLQSIAYVKAPLFTNVPLSILVDLEIEMFKIKRNILNYIFDYMIEYLENFKLFLFLYEKSQETDNHQKIKEAFKKFNLSDSIKSSILKMNMDSTNRLLTEKEENSNNTMEILASLKKLKNFLKTNGGDFRR